VNAQLAAPAGMVVDAARNIYVADSTRVRKISGDGLIATIAGNGGFGYSGDGGLAMNAQLTASALALDSSGNIYVADAGNNSVRLLQPGASGTGISSVANGASILGGPVSPGEVVVLFGAGLGPAQLTTYQLDSSGNVPTSVAGTRVLFNGTPAQILYTWATQVAAVVPSSISGTSVQVIAQYQGQTSAPFAVSVAAAAPGLFTSNSSGQGQAAAFNQDGSLNSANHPAGSGTVISLFATGLGQATPTATIGAQPATVQSVVGLVPGVTQINVKIPTGVNGASAPVFVQVGSVSSQTGVTIAVSP
jgi:uncharacterized protein (TIGR03437 family)